MSNSGKIVLNFSIKNCQKDFSYHVRTEILDISTEKYAEFNTEKAKCNRENEDITFKNTINLTFYFDKQQKIKLHFYKYDKNNKPEERPKYSSLGSLMCHKNSVYKKPFDRNNPQKEVFFVEINKQIGRNSEISVFDYLKAGIRTTGFIALDSSENFKNSLSNYRQILIEIINYLIYNKKEKEYFYTYGFGAKLKDAKYPDVVYKSIFNINTKEKDAPTIYNNIYNEYMKVLNNIISDKKVFYSTLIRKILKKVCELYEIEYYNVLFILAKEMNSNEDKKEVIDAFIESSYLPLSIFIIYEGEKDCTEIRNLFGNHIKESSKGMKKIRNNIVLVSYSKDYDKNAGRMMESCLRELSKHIIEYYKLNNCTPEKIKTNNNNNNNNIERSINQYKSSIFMYESRISLASQPEGNEENEDGLDDFESEKMPNIQGIHTAQKKKSQQSGLSKGDADGKKSQIETPKGEYIIPQGSIVKIEGNPYDKEQKKYTPGISINEGVYNNDYRNIQNPFNKNKNNNNNNITGITPGNYFYEEKDKNQFQKELGQKRFIPEQQSILPDINHNPYQRRQNNQQNQRLFIPDQSYADEDIKLTNMNNPYNRNNNIKNMEKKIMNSDSRTGENISTNNSNNYSESINNSNTNYKFNNYSRDF